MVSAYGHRAFKAHPAWPEPFKATETTSYELQHSEMHVYTIFCETGTRLLLPSFIKQYKDDPTLDTVGLNKLVLRDVVIIDVPKGAK